MLPEGVLTGVAAFQRVVRRRASGSSSTRFTRSREVRLTGQRRQHRQRQGGGQLAGAALAAAARHAANGSASMPTRTGKWCARPSTGQPVVTRYVVDDLRPMPGSPRL